MLDRRIGRRRLVSMKKTIADEPETFREFYAIRAKAEGLMQHPANLPDDRTNQEDVK